MEHSPPDYELADRMTLTSAAQVRANAHPVRITILQLLHERAATVSELAAALDRPKSTVAHHVEVLVRNGMLKVVRTRKVRAIEERFYGRTARMFSVALDPVVDTAPRDFNDLDVAARESLPAYERGELWGFIRHARISEEHASIFWSQVRELIDSLDRMPRSGHTTYGFAVGLYPTDYPALPPTGL